MIKCANCGNEIKWSSFDLWRHVDPEPIAGDGRLCGHPLFAPTITTSLESVLVERVRQTDKWGEQNHDAFTWLAILSEEVGEAAQSALHNKFGGHAVGTLRIELVHVCAVALQWIECIVRNGEAVDVEE